LSDEDFDFDGADRESARWINTQVQGFSGNFFVPITDDGKDDSDISIPVSDHEDLYILTPASDVDALQDLSDGDWGEFCMFNGVSLSQPAR